MLGQVYGYSLDTVKSTYHINSSKYEVTLASVHTVTVKVEL